MRIWSASVNWCTVYSINFAVCDLSAAKSERERAAPEPGEEVERVLASQAPLWGLGRSVGFEHPEMRCSRVDLSLEAEAKETWRALGKDSADEFRQKTPYASWDFGVGDIVKNTKNIIKVRPRALAAS